MLSQQALARGDFVETGDANALVARSLAGHEHDVAARNIERGGEEGDQCLVGRTVDRRRREANENRATPRAVDARARRPRDDADVEISSRLFVLQAAAWGRRRAGRPGAAGAAAACRRRYAPGPGRG